MQTELKKKDVAYKALMVECESLRQTRRSASRDDELKQAKDTIWRLNKENDALYDENNHLQKVIGSTSHKRVRDEEKNKIIELLLFSVPGRHRA
jgi:regulator of replication initiation timing